MRYLLCGVKLQRCHLLYMWLASETFSCLSHQSIYYLTKVGFGCQLSPKGKLKQRLLRKPNLNSALLRKTKTKGSPQSFCSILEYHLWSSRQLLSGYPGSLACSQLPSSFRLPPGGFTWNRHHHWPCSFWFCKFLCSWASQCRSLSSKSHAT